MTTPTPIYTLLLPEFVVVATACVLFLLGGSIKASARRIAPVIALVALLAALVLSVIFAPGDNSALRDSYGSVLVTPMTTVVRVLACAVGVLLVLLAWPGDREGTGNRSISFGTETAEFFALMLLSLGGILVVAGANDLATLFLGIELASIPTYVMVTMSRPAPVAQEAGVKYFFLGAAAAAILLFGFSYIYGTTGLTNLDALRGHFAAARPDGVLAPGVESSAHVLSKLTLVGVTLTLVGLSFKLAAAPMHFYAGDVYQGAATPVTAFLSFVPKTTGVIAIIKLLYALGGASFFVPLEIGRLLWWLAVITMTVGNVLGLLQVNVKRVLAYSSVAHSGYLLMGLAVLARVGGAAGQSSALAALLFYLITYAVMNVAAFGVLMLLPSRSSSNPATTAETYDDLAGTAREKPILGLAMAVACFGLIGLPLTGGFFGKLFLIRAALEQGGAGLSPWLVWLAVITMLNAAISAAYYLKIVATMWARPEALPLGAEKPVAERSMPISLAVGLSVATVCILGVALPLVSTLMDRLQSAAWLAE